MAQRIGGLRRRRKRRPGSFDDQHSGYRSGHPHRRCDGRPEHSRTGDDEKASFSSRGPTFDQLVKPDVYAPGTDIISLSVPGSPLERELPENRVNIISACPAHRWQHPSAPA